MPEPPPEYAEFYSTVATVSPLLLVAQLVWLEFGRRRAVTPLGRWVLVGLGFVATAITLLAIMGSVTTLAGDLPDSALQRSVLQGFVLVQAVTAPLGYLVQAFWPPGSEQRLGGARHDLPAADPAGP